MGMPDASSLFSCFRRHWPWTAWPILWACCSGGLIRIIYAVGYGYGISMVASAALSYLVRFWAVDRPLCATTAWGLALYAGYGTRLFTFLFRRQHSASYLSSKTWARVEHNTQATPLPTKLSLTTFVSLSQLLILATLDALCATPKITPAPVRNFACAAIGALGLLLETVADEQKMAFKALHPDLPIMSGVYSFCRHPNYLGEIIFWIGVVGHCVGNSDAPWHRRLIASVGPLFMIWVMVGAAARADGMALDRYGKDPAFVAWVESTPSLWPRLPF